MSEVLFGLGGLLVGAGVAHVVTLRRLQSQPRPDPDSHPLKEKDREQLTAEFVGHVSAVRQQVSEYADALAGEDAVLRTRLRAFEAGER